MAIEALGHALHSGVSFRQAKSQNLSLALWVLCPFKLYMFYIAHTCKCTTCNISNTTYLRENGQCLKMEYF